MSNMGDRIHQKRKEYGLTMEELGNKLGVNKTAVNKWEKGIVKNIKQTTIKEMADLFEVSPSWLMGFDTNTNDDSIDLSIEEKDLIRIWRTLDEEEKKKVMIIFSFAKKG